MLDQMIESRSHHADHAKRSGFFLATLLLVGTTLASGVLWSLFAKDLSMSGDGLELSAIVAPLPEAKTEPPAPIERQENRPATQQTAKTDLPVRQANVARIDEMQPAPNSVSLTPNAEKSRPNGKFHIGTEDIDPRALSPGNTRGDGGDNASATGIGDQSPQPEIIEKTAPPPPLIVKKTVPETAQKPKQTVSLGVVNGKAKTLPVPIYPATAKAVNAAGNVDVQVLIDETGAVVSAKAVSGHPLLREAAERAARGAKFIPTTLSHQAVKVSGVIVYKFSR